MTGYEAQRHAMVESQIRPNEVTDTALLGALRTIPRERFVPAAFKSFAYMDEGIEVFPASEAAPARVLLAPMVQARLIQLAEIEFQANLGGLKLTDAEIVSTDLKDGWAAQAPYDVIVLEGSVPEVPASRLSQLKEGGRLVAVVTRAPNMRQGKAYLFTRVVGEASGIVHFDAGASPLPGLVPEPVFTF